MYGYILMAAFI